MAKNGYTPKIINQIQKDKLVSKIDFQNLYERKAEIHGTCIKLFCEDAKTIDMWEENFHTMPTNIRPHARLFSIKDKSKKLKVLYEPASKTIFLYNCAYYGWVKSIALALASEYLYDSPSLEGKRYSIHGSYIDISGRGMAIMGNPKAGKTTLTYGLLSTQKSTNFLTDDWFFVRFMGESARAYSAEKNSYAGEDIAKNWKSLKEKIKAAKKDDHGRAIIDIPHLFGSERVRSQSELFTLVILTRDKTLPAWTPLTPKKALSLLTKWDFCNPHQLQRTPKRKKEQIEFFKNLLSRVPAYLLNTVETPKESLARLEGLTTIVQPCQIK